MGAGVRHLSSLHALQSLSMRYCKSVMGEAFASFSEVRGLRSVNLANCVSLSPNGTPPLLVSSLLVQNDYNVI